MSKRERILGVLLVIVTILGLGNVAMAQDNKKSFSPDREITRAEAATMIWRAHGSQQSDIDPAEIFGDINPEAYYAEALAWAYENGITKGTGVYNPDPLADRDWPFEVEDAIVKAAAAFGQDPNKLAAIAHCESGGDPTAVSRTNDWGLFQHNKSNPGGDAVGRFARFGFDFETTWSDPYVNAYVAAGHADEKGSYQPWYLSRHCHEQYAL